MDIKGWRNSKRTGIQTGVSKSKLGYHSKLKTNRIANRVLCAIIWGYERDSRPVYFEEIRTDGWYNRITPDIRMTHKLNG